ncbi:uncharacterized protein LOC114287146 [Camellia sinensis]|uniref:uncharacterized protein LOC114287146 n=1 Tax=Camellia sinensis TaxID=4442 RepID=UPI0010360051|nr:uncharacterized protein LOC114287146 [Camellia sinensis]
MSGRMEIDSNVGDIPSVNEGEEVEESKKDDGQLKSFAIERSQAGERKKKSEVNPLKLSLSTKIGCKARVRGNVQKDEEYKLTTVNLEYNHDLILTDSRHFAMNKKILTPAKKRLEINDQARIRVSRNLYELFIVASWFLKIMLHYLVQLLFII